MLRPLVVPLLAGAVCILAACGDGVTEPPESADLAFEESGDALFGESDDLALDAAAWRSGRFRQARLVRLGDKIFFDENLSLRRNQSCASCHDPEFGWTGPNPVFNAGGGVHEGSVPGRFASRKPPTAAYAAVSPLFGFDGSEFTGGNFSDGRATGELLGNPSADQALNPFLGFDEQALRDPACVVFRVGYGPYRHLYRSVWSGRYRSIKFPHNMDRLCEQEGDQVPLRPKDRSRVEREYNRIAISIAAFESSRRVNRFSSKFDRFLAGRAQLSGEEELGLELFNGTARCNLCHTSSGSQPLFTGFGYANIGTPPNPENPALVSDPSFVDLGLGAFLLTRPEWAAMADGEMGTHKIPSVRNVDKRPYAGAPKAFTHNGFFKTLEQIVHFYNTRDVKPACPASYTAAQAMAADCWPAPEVAQNVTGFIMGNLGLTAAEEEAIVAFMRTLSDR
jgi:cytochrome c peroxidase